MIAARSIWRENWKVWVPAAVVAVTAAGFLALYLTSYADRVGVLRTRLGEERARLAGLRADHSRLEAARQRLGDVALVAHQTVSFNDAADSGPFQLIGRHGSLTAAEMFVPLLVGEAR